MNYCTADLAALKSFDSMRCYAERQLSGRTVGKCWRCACPWGSHRETLKVEIREYKGEGRATCWACGKISVNLLELAGACTGISNTPGHLGELMEHIAAVTGYHLSPRQATAKRRKKAAKLPSKGSSETNKQALHHAAQAGASGGSEEHLTACGEEVGAGTPEQLRALILEAVERARSNPERMAAYASDLRLPSRAFLWHLDAVELADYGLCGLTPRGQLLFISAGRDESSGELKVQAVKVRAPKQGKAPAELISGGRWIEAGMLDAGKPGGKFRACIKGAGASLWGAGALRYHDTAIITEGESDKLAVDCSVAALMEAYQTGLDDMSEYLPGNYFPAAVASPGCRAFKAEWAVCFRGKAVIILADADIPGQEGARRVASMLHDAGVRTVKVWSPQQGFKDAREQYNPEEPCALVNDILRNCKPI